VAVYEQEGRKGVRYWVVDFRWVDLTTGKERRVRRAAKDTKNRPATSRTAAEQHEHRLRTSLAAGTFDPPEAPPEVATLAAFKERYFRDHVSRLKASSRDYQERVWRTFLPLLGDAPLDRIDAEALAMLTRKLQEPRAPHGRGLSAKTINNVLSAVRTALSHAAEWGLIAAVPKVRWLRVAQSKFAFFDFDEAGRLLAAAAAEPMGAMVVLALRTGLRIGELLALQWSDVSLERKQIVVSRSVWWKGGQAFEAGTKSGKVRTIPLTADALAALKGYRPASERSGYVFTGENGKQLAQTQVVWLLWRAEDAAGLKRGGWHITRHTFCSHLAMRGVALPAIKELAGHAQISTTMRYAHLAPDHLRQAIAALG
jgi:integrase